MDLDLATHAKHNLFHWLRISHIYALDNHLQVDLILLDFVKAFDRVPHKRFMQKLSSYGIDSCTYQWIETWLTQRTQYVVMDGECSLPASVLSGVPQGTVLRPLMFLIETRRLCS